jgi:predicted transposase/invertase (TIGR01784 family)
MPQHFAKTSILKYLYPMNPLYSDDQLFIPIISDYGFKATFGNDSNTLFLRTALQALIKSEVPIKEVKFDKNTFEGITQDGRSGIFDLACTDENNNHFIVEMQFGEAPNFVQRMKFYALHKFNSMVRKGKFDYSGISKIYCVGILAKNILPFKHCHAVSNLRNEDGELFDEQMTFVTIELDKFTLQEADIQTDLEKLIYTMQNLHTVTQPIQFPKFWNEEWLKIALDELDRRKMTPDERASFEILIARNAESVKAETRKIKAAELATKTNAINKALMRGKLSVEDIADYNDVSVEFVLEIQNSL